LAHHAKLGQCIIIYPFLPSRSNGSYVDNLYAITGTVTSKSTISCWFKDFFPINGGFRKPNLVPVDKFKPRNLWRAAEYAEAISIIAPHKLRFGDEKLIKGSEVYCRRTRRNVLTGKSMQSFLVINKQSQTGPLKPFIGVFMMGLMIQLSLLMILSRHAYKDICELMMF
jgi:hypothetical protein